MQSTNYNNRTYYLFDTIEEFINHVNGLKISRTINKLQVHHTSAPSYDNWKTDIELRRIKNTVDYHKKTFNTNDIAQHYTIFPNGKIATGRDINATPIGIKGWNTGAICCEIYGNFDIDIMTDEQKESVIAFYGTWCKKLNIKPTLDTVRPHCWFTSGGTYLGDYNSSKSAKTCPGTKFFGGNTKSSMKANFLPLIQSYINGQVNTSTPNTSTNTTTGKYIVRYLQQTLNEVYGTKLDVDGLYGPATKAAVKSHYLKKGHKNNHVVWLQKALVNRGYKIDTDGSFGPATLEALKKYQKSRGLTVDGIAGVDTHTKIIND